MCAFACTLVYVYIYIYMCVCKFAYVDRGIYAPTSLKRLMNAGMYVYIYIQVCISKNVRVCISRSALMSNYMHMYFDVML